ncbi:MAG TPA: hypothetical protein VE968_06630 [Sphingomicrobium sp.]|nr:hypothetical protein [Sphingomicrobium sp.]
MVSPKEENDPDDPPVHLRDRFGITPLLDTEIDVAGAGLVGLTANADHDLRIDVTSAVIARFLGTSLATARKHIKDVKEHFPKDQIIRELCQLHLHRYDQFYRTIPIRTDGPIGVFAFDLAMIRSRASIELMLVTARQGFLIEPCLIARSLVEQFAYSVRVWGTEDDAIVFLSKPQALIRYLSSINPSAGRAYGMLSRLSHYDPKMHYSFIGSAEKNGDSEESSTVLQRSWKFKIAALAWVFFVLDLKFKVFAWAYGKHENFACLEPLRGSIEEAYDEFFADVDFPAVKEVRTLLS